jgi:hypothetical protein
VSKAPYLRFRPISVLNGREVEDESAAAAEQELRFRLEYGTMVPVVKISG